MTSRLPAVWSSGNLFHMMFVLHLLFLALVLFDVHIVGSTFGFLYITFVPGFILLRLLRLKDMCQLETILFSAGLSIALLMIVGLLTNEIGLVMGVSKPLSKMPLAIVLTGVVASFCLLDSCTQSRYESKVFDSLKSIAGSPIAVLSLCLPFLSVVGAIWMNTCQNNSILLSMIIAIVLLFIGSLISVRLLPPKLYPIVVLMIAISLLFHSSFISNYLQSGGSDICLEFAVFKITEENALWNSVLEQVSYTPIARYNNMLSITILPTIFSNLTNMDATWVLKMLYPLLFSLVPLALYHLWRAQFGSRIAFISAFLFMAQQTFYTEMLGLGRQMVAEFFFVLLFVVVLDKKMKSSKKIICFTILSTALIFSHYAMSLIFLFFLLFFWILSLVLDRWRTHYRKTTLTMVILFSALLFSWYIFTSNSATFDAILQFTGYVFDELGEWANPASRGTTVLRGLGMEVAPSIWNSISRGFAYLVQFLIVVGFIGLIREQVIARRDRGYLTFVLLSMVLLAALALVPGFAETLNMTRFYHILLFFLAPLGVLGVGFLVKSTSKRKKELTISFLLLGVLIPYFLFQTNFVYEVVGSDSWSLPLSKYRMESLRLYGQYRFMDGQSVFGAKWLSKNVEIESISIYADIQARSSALTYCKITYEGHVQALSNVTNVVTDGTIYLNRLNVIHGTILGTHHRWNLSEFSPIFDGMSRIYSNGASEIYRNTIGD